MRTRAPRRPPKLYWAWDDTLFRHLVREKMRELVRVESEVMRAIGLNRQHLNIARSEGRLVHNVVGICEELGLDPYEIMARCLYQKAKDGIDGRE